MNEGCDRMAVNLPNRLRHAWSAFMNKDPTIRRVYYGSFGGNYSRNRLTRGNTQSIINPLYNRIAIDCSQVSIMHVRTDDKGRYLEQMDSKLNNCLTLDPNIDQTSRAFVQDAVLSLLDKGVIAIVPVRATFDPELSEAYDVEQLRVGEITDWYPDAVRISLYNESTGKREEIVMLKKAVAIVENPFYSVMNESNSLAQRLIRKLNLLDAVDEQSCSGKLDLIIQLPYATKTELRKQQAERRRTELEQQLAGSKYGVAYADGTEKIVQLNRSVENNLLSTVEYLTSMLYSQLGMTQGILDGSADEQTLLNYHSRLIEPIISAIADEIKRKFLSKTARSQNQSIMFFRDPFKLVPVSQIAEIGDKMTRNEIMTSNEIRQVIGLQPSSDTGADELRNKNLSQSKDELEAQKAPNTEISDKKEENQNA